VRSSSSRPSTSCHCVGTPWPTVTRSEAMIARASDARHGAGVITVVMPWAISSQTLVMEPTWAKGSGERRRSPGRLSASAPSLTAARHRWSKTAPLGRPVVPLVHTTATGSSSCSTGRVRGGGPSQAACASSRVTNAPGPAPAPEGSATPRAGSTTVTAGAARATMLATSAGPRRGLTPLVTAPSRSAAA
jgi:hypothetical protein